MLTLEDFSVGYPQAGRVVLSDLRLEVQPGAFVCVLGRNGAGKSTLMRTIAGLQSALSGRSLLDGDDVAKLSAAERARRIAVVLTERAGGPGLTVDDVVRMGRQPFTDWRGALTADDLAITAAALKSAGADPFSGRLFDDLSDGERQRVMIARAMAQTPRLMVLDEITAFLDLPGRVEVMSLLRRYARDRGSAVLLSSHDLDLSLQLADVVWLLDGRGALHIGSPAELVAQGQVGAAFDTDEVSFSPASGRFELRTSPS
jgi:iron complex transport system ATP-binding protein